MNLTVAIGPTILPNPVMVASGTFGYARELAGSVDLSSLGGIVPKTVTRYPRAGNPPPRTVETASGMLNAIGLDNDGVEHFCEHHWPFLTSLGVPIVPNIAGKSVQEFAELCAFIDRLEGVAAIELNLSCPNVSGGIDFATDPALAAEVVRACKGATRYPLWAKLTPNVADIRPVAGAVRSAGCDALTVSNTLVGMAIDWRRKRPILGNTFGGLSGPAIKPVVLRLVYLLVREGVGPIVGVGGVQSADDVMEFLVAGASAVQVGTANFYSPNGAVTIIDELPTKLAELGVESIEEARGLAQK